MEWSDLIDKVYTTLTLYGLRVVSAIAIFVIGRWVAKGVIRLIERLMVKRKVDETLVSFVSNLGYVALLAFVIVAALNKLGIQTASFIAVLGAAGLAIGLALQGSLSNFAAGILMIIFRPFKVGDYIEGAGVAGTVESIQIFTTQLKTPDNKTIIIPNAKISGDNIVNYSTKGTRRVDMVFSIGYGDDIDKARQIIMHVITNDERVLKDPEPVVVLSELADSSVNLTTRAWSKSADVWDIFFETTERVKKTFDAQGISIPFPQRDIHIYEQKTETA
ncbi:MscS3: predicted mechanosensitive ion channel [Desulfosarcina variabilis str. Montpellier]|uniref:mechanosensitive ion channel family protein n=1 Tax=Desulfosarcina variabilis TaxID=2300 RepID=UPI003AFB5028